MRPTALVVLALALILPPVAAQQVVLVRAPQGILQPVGGPAQTDSFMLANAGKDPAQVRLVPGGPFTVSPLKFTIAPGTSTKVTIQPNPVPSTPLSFTSGSVDVTVSGIAGSLTVPVRIGAASPPTSRARVTSNASVVLTSGFSPLAHPGKWSVQNGGTSPINGMLTSDKPWLIPQDNVVTVPAGGSAQLTFTVDPKRSAVAPLGAITGTLSFLFVTGTTPAVSSVSAEVRDTATKGPIMLSTPPPADAQTISFFPIVSEPSGVTNDLFFANRGTVALPSDLRFFYTAAGATPSTALLADVGSTPAGMAAWFPSAPASIFGFGNGTGSIQVRGGDPNVVALALNRSVSPDRTNVYTTSMPILRSDRAVPAGGAFFFSGVEKSATAETDIFLQETAGLNAAYAIDFYDANGTVLAPALNGSLPPFSSVSVRDAAPAGARSARVRNTSTTAAQLSGFASVLDLATFDLWTIAGMTAAAPSDLVLFVPSDAPASSTFDAWITNPGSSPAVVTVGGTPAAAPPVKTRAVRRNPLNGEGTIVLAAGETRRVPLSGVPYVHISSPAGIVATGRLTTTAAGHAGAFGTGVPAVPSALFAAAGDAAGHFFRATDSAGDPPLNVNVLEVANRQATVRVTVAFNFAAGAIPSAHLELSRDFDLTPGEALLIPDVMHAVIGDSRDNFGDLVDITVDVQVIAGDGRVVAYSDRLDPVSGDLTLTAGD